MKATVRCGFVLMLTALSVVVWAVAQSTPVRKSPVVFSDAASEFGINFKHDNGASAEKHLPETMGGGALIFDYDNDGWTDILFVNGGTLAGKPAVPARHRLYRNREGRGFSDVTASSGIVTSGYGMGACAADYDNDGWSDLYITGVVGNRLYRNTGKGGFEDVTDRAGVASSRWSASCAFADIDNDGYVDLYVTRYVDYSPDNNKRCNLTEKARSYCYPDKYNSIPDVLFRNRGDGTFADVSRTSGIAARSGNGLGVVFGDVDGDGWIDIFVANDTTPNFLFRNKGAGVFEEVGFRSGVAFGRYGMSMAGMGTDMGDIDGSGRMSIIVTNLQMQGHSLFRNLPEGLFADATFSSGLGAASLAYVGFGAVFFDYDNDRDLDLAIANGDVIDNVRVLGEDRRYEQPRLLLQNDGAGRFTDVGPASGAAFNMKRAGRSLVAGDLDNDGDLDLVAANVGQVADVLRNEGGNRSNSLVVRTVGLKSNRDGIGARLRLIVAGKVLLRDVKAGSSYLGQNDVRVHFGMGDAAKAERLEIVWPSGMVDEVKDLGANQILTVTEGSGVTAHRAFSGKKPL